MIIWYSSICCVYEICTQHMYKHLVWLYDDTHVCSDKSKLPSNLWYKVRSSGQYTCWSLRCSWSIACRCCSNCIFIILYLVPFFNGLSKDKGNIKGVTLKCWNLMRLILEVWRCIMQQQNNIEYWWIQTQRRNCFLNIESEQWGNGQV